MGRLLTLRRQRDNTHGRQPMFALRDFQSRVLVPGRLLYEHGMSQSNVFLALSQIDVLDSNTRLPRGRESNVLPLNMSADFCCPQLHDLPGESSQENRGLASEGLSSKDREVNPRLLVGSYIPTPTFPTSSALASTGPAGHTTPQPCLRLRIRLRDLCQQQCLRQQALSSLLMLHYIGARRVPAMKMVISTRLTTTKCPEGAGSKHISAACIYTRCTPDTLVRAQASNSSWTPCPSRADWRAGLPSLGISFFLFSSMVSRIADPNTGRCMRYACHVWICGSS
jgi:hypothetical protein